MGYFAGLFDPKIAIVEAPLSGEPPRLPADEAISVARAVPRRRQEFAMGRDCARRAMSALGHAEVSLPRGQDRSPIWPKDLVGSITHTETWAAAAVARRDQGFAAIGIDLEAAIALPPELWENICTPRELAKLARAGGMDQGLAARLAFCMKEAAFKCQFPLSGGMLEFGDLALEADGEAGTFGASYLKAVPPFRAGDRLAGRFATGDGHFASAVVLMAEGVR